MASSVCVCVCMRKKSRQQNRERFFSCCCCNRMERDSESNDKWEALAMIQHHERQQQIIMKMRTKIVSMRYNAAMSHKYQLSFCERSSINVSLARFLHWYSLIQFIDKMLMLFWWQIVIENMFFIIFFANLNLQCLKVCIGVDCLNK